MGHCYWQCNTVPLHCRRQEFIVDKIGTTTTVVLCIGNRYEYSQRPESRTRFRTLGETRDPRMQASPAAACAPVVGPPIPTVSDAGADALQATEPTPTSTAPAVADAATAAMSALSLGADANSTSSLYVHASLSCFGVVLLQFTVGTIRSSHSYPIDHLLGFSLGQSYFCGCHDWRYH